MVELIVSADKRDGRTSIEFKCALCHYSASISFTEFANCDRNILFLKELVTEHLTLYHMQREVINYTIKQLFEKIDIYEFELNNNDNKKGELEKKNGQ